MSTVKDAKLKYLWSALFEDETQIDEPIDDRYSKHDDTAEANPSAFRDILDKEKESKLVAFWLTNQETGDKIGVDLETGQFAVNGVAFDAHNQFIDVTDKELKIIFHREVREETTRTTDEWKVQGIVHYINRYFIGWQIVGEDISQTIAVG